MNREQPAAWPRDLAWVETPLPVPPRGLRTIATGRPGSIRTTSAGCGEHRALLGGPGRKRQVSRQAFAISRSLVTVFQLRAVASTWMCRSTYARNFETANPSGVCR